MVTVILAGFGEFAGVGRVAEFAIFAGAASVVGFGGAALHG
jgi:hypothetical protein